MKNDEIAIGFALNKVKTEQFACYEELYDSAKGFDITTRFQCKLDQTHKQIGVFFILDFNQKKKHLIRMEVSCHFLVDETSWNQLIDKEKQEISIPKNFLSHLAMVTLGTARGVFHIKSEGTSFAGFTLPLFNISEMISDQITFPVSSD